MGFLFALFAVLPLAVDFSHELPYEPLKILLIEIGAIAGAAALFVVGFARRSTGSFRKLAASMGPLDYAVMAWLVVLSLSTACSVDPASSFWGSAERGTGFLYYWCLTAIYFVVRSAAQPRDWRLFLRFTSVVACAVSVYGILQWLGVDAPGLRQAFRLYGRSGPTRAFSTFGHPNFLGVYLALWLPFAWYMWRGEARRLWRPLAAVSGVLSAMALVLTYSRGAWLGAGAGLAVGLAFRQIESGKWNRKMLAALVALAVVSCGLLVWQAPRLKGSANSFAYRIGTSFDFTQGSTLARTAEWSYAVGLLPARPILGYGLDTYIRYAGERVKDPAERNRDFQAADPSLADRLHNLALDILWATGIVGLVAFGLVLVCVFIRVRKLFIENKESRHWLTVLCSGLAVYLVCGLTGFDFSLSGLWFYLLLAGVASAGTSGSPFGQKTSPQVVS